jgi:hypothetical protein
MDGKRWILLLLMTVLPLLTAVLASGMDRPGDPGDRTVVFGVS